jgi:hypothetical protein
LYEYDLLEGKIERKEMLKEIEEMNRDNSGGGVTRDLKPPGEPLALPYAGEQRTPLPALLPAYIHAARHPNGETKRHRPPP